MSFHSCAILMLAVLFLASHDVLEAHLLSIPTGDGSTRGRELIASAMNSTSPILLSDDGSYAWQFAPYQNNNSRLLLTVLSTAYNTTIVWIANRHRPVSPNASLFVQLPLRTFILQDADGSVAWSPPVVDVNTVVMNSSGNLIMYNTQNASIWQSFDSATDVMVPGQIVRTNHSLISRLSVEDVSEGHYTLHIETGGAVLYANFDWQQHMVPYVIFPYAGLGQPMYAYGGAQLYAQFKSQFDIALQSKCNHTDLLYRIDGSGVQLQQEASVITEQCRGEIKQYGVVDYTPGVNFATRLGGDGFRYLQLMAYGDIVAYLSTNSGVVVDNQFVYGKISTYCGLPSYCGPNSLCSLVANNNTCTCPHMFEPIDPSDARLGCRLVIAFNCSIASQHQFLPIQGVDYYANAYLPGISVSGYEECENLCRANCSCTTAFYHNESRKCHVYDQVQTMQSGADPSITAYLRVAKLPQTGGQRASNRISRKVIIGVTTSTALMVLIFVLFVAWIGRRIMNKPKEEPDSEEEAFLEGLPGLPPRFTYTELQSATEGFSKKLGTGGSGTVYEGQIPPAKQLTKIAAAQQDSLVKVAVKQLQLSKFSNIAASGKKQFRAEVATLGSLSHVNLVQLRGFCAEGVHRLLIYEFLENGSLDRWIFNSVTPLQWEVRYHIAIDAARGLAFLHEGSRDKVVHLDVKPQNILLDANFRAKLADFGLCKLVGRSDQAARAGEGGAPQSQIVTAMRGTPGYMAPEWFLSMPVTDKSDVFSYGMVLLELVGGRKNLNLAAGSEDEWYFPAWAVGQAERGNLLDVIDKELTIQEEAMGGRWTCDMRAAMSRLLHVAFWCIQETAGSRPSMSTVLLMLEEHLQVPEPPLNHTYILRHQSRPPLTFNATSDSKTSSSILRRASTPVSGINSEIEPR